MKNYTTRELERIKDYAMLASYHLIGVQDQRFINRMVAQSLLDKKSVYIEERHKIKDEKVTSVLDEYHENN